MVVLLDYEILQFISRTTRQIARSIGARDRRRTIDGGTITVEICITLGRMTDSPFSPFSPVHPVPAK
jgi:hypothetical protein